MLEKLYEAERLLPDLLESPEGWTGLYAGTERPNLARVWRQWGEHRISLHEFGPCGPQQVFSHAHEWDSAIRILEEACEMAIDFSEDPAAPFKAFSTFILPPGAAYEMLGPGGRHWVRPTGPNGYRSIMVSGRPLYRQNRQRVNTPSRLLAQDEILAQLGRFKRRYPHLLCHPVR